MVGLVLGSCSSGTSSGSTTTTTAGPGTTSSAGSTTSSASAAPTSVAPGQGCVAADLEGSVEGTEGGAGTTETTFALKNVSTHTCVTGGYPGLQLLDASGNQLADDPVRGGGLSFEKVASSLVTLASGQTAWFNVGTSDVPSGSSSCDQAASVQIIPPNDVTHLTVSGLNLTACDGGLLDESALFGAGSAASQTTAPPAPS